MLKAIIKTTQNNNATIPITIFERIKREGLY